MNRLVISLSALAVLSGCPLLLGKTYQRFDPVPGGMGVIYLYAGDDITPLQNVHVDRDPDTAGATHVISLVEKGYFPYLVPAGVVRVFGATDGPGSCVSLPVTVNSHHWVRVSSTPPHAVAVEQSVAEAEMSGFRQISRESMGASTGSFGAGECPMPGDGP